MGRLKKSPSRRKLSTSSDEIQSVPSIVRLRRNKVRKLVLGAVLGYLGGVFLTYMWFLFFATQLHFALPKATHLGVVLAVILTIGLAFNKNVRCIVILIMPNFFSAKGRSALVAYAFVLAMTGPTKNILENINVLSGSLSCGQEQLKEALEGMLDVIKRPLQAIKQSVKLAMKAMKKTMEKIEKILVMIKDLIKSILKAIKKVFEWLGSVVNMCNKQMGTPYKRCMDLFEEARIECRNRMGALKFMCNVTYVVETICYAVKFIDFICILIDFVSDAIVGTVQRKLKEFVQEIKNMFYVSVKFDHKFNFTTHSSKNLSQVGADIMADIKRRSRRVFFVMGWMEMFASLFLLRIVLKAVIYKSKYQSNDRFDNTYITKDFVTVDEKRREMGPEMISVNVTGSGFIAEIYDGIIKAFSPMAEKYDIDPIPCLPDPKPPKYDRYIEIGILILFCWALIIFEPYGLRLRQIIMRSFYPERSKERAVWLHSQILMRRTSFLKFARRKARLEFGKNKKGDQMSFMDWLRANTDRWWIMRKILGKSRTVRCMLCASPIAKTEEPIKCPKPGCRGTYCKECFDDMENKCFLCSEPVEYGDFSDLSEEKDSSDEPDEVIVDNVSDKNQSQKDLKGDSEKTNDDEKENLIDGDFNDSESTNYNEKSKYKYK